MLTIVAGAFGAIFAQAQSPAADMLREIAHVAAESSSMAEFMENCRSNFPSKVCDPLDMAAGNTAVLATGSADSWRSCSFEGRPSVGQAALPDNRREAFQNLVDYFSQTPEMLALLRKSNRKIERRLQREGLLSDGPSRRLRPRATGLESSSRNVETELGRMVTLARTSGAAAGREIAREMAEEANEEPVMPIVREYDPELARPVRPIVRPSVSQSLFTSVKKYQQQVFGDTELTVQERRRVCLAQRLQSIHYGLLITMAVSLVGGIIGAVVADHGLWALVGTSVAVGAMIFSMIFQLAAIEVILRAAKQRHAAARLEGGSAI